MPHSIPAVVYGGGKPALAVWVGHKEFVKLAQQPESFQPGELQLDGKARRVLIKAVQSNNKTGMPIHVDFLDLTEAKHFTLSLTIKTTGSAPGIKRGGVLNILVPRLEVTIDKTAQTIPTEITIDLSEMQIGAVCHLSDLNLPAGIHATNPARDNTILTILPPSGSEGAETKSA